MQKTSTGAQLSKKKKKSKNSGGYLDLEHQLGVNTDYSNVKWDYNPIYSLYVIHDQGNPVYYGISKQVKNRIKAHARDPKSAAYVFLNEKLDEGFELSDLHYVKARNLTQRQAAILELEAIYANRSKFLLNSRSIWLPNGMTDGTRLAQSIAFQGNIIPAISIQAAKAKNTNTLKFDLFKRGVFVRTFENTSRSDLAEWLRTEFSMMVDPSALWRMIVGRRDSYKGFTVVHYSSGSSSQKEGRRSSMCELDEVVKLRKALPLRPFVISTGSTGREELTVGVVGNTKLAREELRSYFPRDLKLTANTIEYLLSGRHQEYNGFKARYLTDKEIESNLKAFKYPLCYVYSVDNEPNSVCRNLSDLKERYGFSQTSLTRGLVLDYTFSNGRRIEINLLQTRALSYLIPGVTLLSPVKEETTPRRRAAKTSNVVGVTWNCGRNSWQVNRNVEGRCVFFKQSQDRIVCEDIAKFIQGLEVDGKLDERAVTLGLDYARSFKKKNGVWYKAYQTVTQRGNKQ